LSIASRPRRSKIRLGELLIAAGVIDETQLKAALAEQKKWGGKLGRTLVDMGFLTEELMVRALARQLGLPKLDPAEDPLPPTVTTLLGVQFCERYGVMPVGGDAEKRVVQLATSDPTNYQALDEIAFHTGLRVEPVVSAPSSIDKAIRKYYYGEEIKAQKTATPADLGIAEQQMEVAAPAAPPPPPAAPSADLERIETLLSGQVRALRALVETLIDNGLISRDEYLAKVRGNRE
jgi:type IV pilus assembly protein PilB